MESESRELPAAVVASTARMMATRWVWITLIPGVITLLFALTMLAAQINPRPHHTHTVAGIIFANIVAIGLPGLLTVFYLLRARRYAKLAKLAAEDTSLTWHLAGKLIAAGRAGVPVPELTIGIAGYLRRSLTAVPRATLLQ